MRVWQIRYCCVNMKKDREWVNEWVSEWSDGRANEQSHMNLRYCFSIRSQWKLAWPYRPYTRESVWNLLNFYNQIFSDKNWWLKWLKILFIRKKKLARVKMTKSEGKEGSLVDFGHAYQMPCISYIWVNWLDYYIIIDRDRKVRRERGGERDLIPYRNRFIFCHYSILFQAW